MPEARPGGYRRQSESTLAATLAGAPGLRELLGGTAEQWSVTEVGDGNLNLVFIVRGPRGGVVAKQALPFVRMVGESWPLPLSRSHFEHLALLEQGRLCPGATPAVLHRDDDLALTVMELLEPHVVLRRGLMSGTTYPRFADAISTFLARTAFLTSDLALPAARKKERMAVFAGNTAMCKITEDLVFTEPFHAAPNNRWTSPALDEPVQELRGDTALKLAAARLKLKFLQRAEALLHGDLHTGAIMVTAEDTRVIDAEFAVYGPMAFDVGMLLGNLLISACARSGHAAATHPRDEHAAWILDAAVAVWEGFHAKFLELWQNAAPGDAFAPPLFEGAEAQAALDQERRAHLAALFSDALGFAGLEMIRRVVGLSHVADLEAIGDPGVRAAGERRVLEIGRELVLAPGRFGSMRAVTARVVDARALGA